MIQPDIAKTADNRGAHQPWRIAGWQLLNVFIGEKQIADHKRDKVNSKPVHRQNRQIQNKTRRINDQGQRKQNPEIGFGTKSAQFIFRINLNNSSKPTNGRKHL